MKKHQSKYKQQIKALIKEKYVNFVIGLLTLIVVFGSSIFLTIKSGYLSKIHFTVPAFTKVVPTSTPKAASTQIRTYVVQDGDFLTAISMKFYGNEDSVDKILKANNISDANLIESGTKLIIP